MRALRAGSIGNLLLLPVADERLLLLRSDPPFVRITHGVVSCNNREGDLLLLVQLLDAIHFHLMPLRERRDSHRPRRQAPLV